MMLVEFAEVASLTMRALTTAVLVVIAGCASVARDGGIAPVNAVLEPRLGNALTLLDNETQRQAAQTQIAQWLAEPLTVDTAVKTALLGHPGLQAALRNVTVAEADWVQASRLPNPALQLTRVTRDGELEIERSLTFNLLSLLTMPQASAAGKRRLERTRLDTAIDVLAVATEVRVAYYGAVAAVQTAHYAKQVLTAAEAGAELARRMAEVGNFSRLDQAREQQFYADAATQLARAEQQRVAAHERLLRALGLGESPGLILPERLPDLPPAAEERDNLESLAMQQRLDLQAARFSSASLAKQLGLVRTTRFIDVLEVGPAQIKDGTSADPYKRGYQVGFLLPLFDFGGARVAKSKALYEQSLDRARQTALTARSQVRETYHAYRTAYDVARHYRDEIVPLRKRISDEMLLRYNGMLASVFELLADSRAQATAVNAAIEAQRDFWLAHAQLEMALVGSPIAIGAALPPMVQAMDSSQSH
jgi:outer membrane protein TolC